MPTQLLDMDQDRVPWSSLQKMVTSLPTCQSQMKERFFHHHSTPDDKPWEEEESSLGANLKQATDTKITNFYESITANEQVLRLDVTMNDILQTAHWISSFKPQQEILIHLFHQEHHCFINWIQLHFKHLLLTLLKHMVVLLSYT